MFVSFLEEHQTATGCYLYVNLYIYIYLNFLRPECQSREYVSIKYSVLKIKIPWRLLNENQKKNNVLIGTYINNIFRPVREN